MANPKNKILIAEDDPFLVKIISNRLKEEGFDIEIASDGEEALQAIQKGGLSLILLDLIMPKKTGFEVLKGMKDEKIDIPAFVFSNLSQEEDKKEVLSLGAKGFFIKSDIAIDDLVKTVKKELKI